MVQIIVGILGEYYPVPKFREQLKPVSNILQFYSYIVSLNLAIKTIVENPTKIVFNQYPQVKVMVQ